MKREFLQNLGLEQEAINSVMAEYGKSVNELNKQVADLKASESELTAVTAERDTLKSTNEALSAQLETAKAESDKAKREANIDISLHKVGVKDKYTDYIKAQLSDVELDDVETKLNELKGEMSELFIVEEKPVEEPKKGFQVVDTKLKEGAPTPNLTIDDIMAIEDKAKREKAIMENSHLF